MLYNGKVMENLFNLPNLGNRQAKADKLPSYLVGLGSNKSSHRLDPEVLADISLKGTSGEVGDQAT